MQELVISGVPTTSVLVVSVISAVNVYQYTPTFVFHGEKHKAWELVYVDIGQVVIGADGQEFTLSSKQIFLHKPYEFHKIRANNQNCSVLIISFETAGGEDDLLSLCGRIHTIPQADQQNLKNIITESDVAFAKTNFYEDKVIITPQYGSLQAIRNYLEIFLILSLRPNKNKQGQETPQYNNIMESAVEYLGEHLKERVTLDDMARALGYSKSYLSKLFLRTTQKSVIEYLIDLRIERAKKMMAEGTCTFSEISEELGFSSLQYFSSMFKKKTGYTPSQYNNSLKVHHRFNPERH